MKYLYLHGLGQTRQLNRVIKETKVSESVKLSLAEMLEGKSATYMNYISAFHQNVTR